jgi:hypothetical protein
MNQKKALASASAFFCPIVIGQRLARVRMNV